eukprot:12579-Pyramimonas_sp.AAC.1
MSGRWSGGASKACVVRPCLKFLDYLVIAMSQPRQLTVERWSMIKDGTDLSAGITPPRTRYLYVSGVGHGAA